MVIAGCRCFTESTHIYLKTQKHILHLKSYTYEYKAFNVDYGHDCRSMYINSEAKKKEIKNKK